MKLENKRDGAGPYRLQPGLIRGEQVGVKK